MCGLFETALTRFLFPFLCNRQRFFQWLNAHHRQSQIEEQNHELDSSDSRAGQGATGAAGEPLAQSSIHHLEAAPIMRGTPPSLGQGQGASQNFQPMVLSSPAPGSVLMPGQQTPSSRFNISSSAEKTTIPVGVALSMSPTASATAAAAAGSDGDYSNPYRHRLYHQSPQDSVGVMAEVEARRSQQQRTDTSDAGSGRNNATADCRRSVAEPRLLWSDLDGTTCVSSSSHQGGRTAMADAAGRNIISGQPQDENMAIERAANVEGVVNESAGDEEGGGEVEETRNILAVCRHGDKLGVAAVRHCTYDLYTFEGQME